MMGSFNDYLKRLKDTPEYIAAGIYDEFAESVWSIRRQKGMKQKDIAEKMGVSPPYLSKQLRGRKKLTISAICKIAHALNCEVKIELVPKERAGGMTNRDELNAMSNAEFGAWLSDLIPEDYPCGMCPAYRFCKELIDKARLSGEIPDLSCAAIIADWLSVEE